MVSYQRQAKSELPVEKKTRLAWWTWDAIADETHRRTTWVTGGIGSAKSFGAAVWNVQRCLQNGAPLSDPIPTVSWAVAPTYLISENSVIKSTINVLWLVFGMRAGVHYHFQKTHPRKISFCPIGVNHEIHFLSADNPTHFVAADLTHWWWSEVGISKAETYEKLEDRLRDKRGKVVQSLGEGSPEGLNHFADLANFGGGASDSIDLERNFRRFRIETGDNAHNLSPGYLEALRARYAYDTSKLLSYERGLFVPFSKSTAYWEFAESRSVIACVEPSPMQPLLFCWDFNVSPLAWVVAQKFWAQRSYYSPRVEKVVALEESSGEERGLMDAVASFAARFPASQYRDTEIQVHGDASGWARSHKGNTGSDYDNIEQYLRNLGYRRVEICALRSNPEVRQRLEKVNALLAYEMLAVTPNCRRLIQGFVKTSLKEGTWKIEKPQGEDWTHYPDSLGYLCWALYKEVEVVNPHGASKILGIAA